MVLIHRSGARNGQRASLTTPVHDLDYNLGDTRVAAYGDLYLIGGVKYVRQTFGARISRLGYPHVNVRPYFKKLAGGKSPKIITATVKVANHRFKLYGSLDSSLPVNDLLGEIKPTTIWTGEIAVFLLGRKAPLRSNPQFVRRAFHKEAISLFISRVVEALDLNKPLPEIIS